MHYSHTTSPSVETQSLTVRGSLPAWLTGTLSRQIAGRNAAHALAMNGDDGDGTMERLHTFSLRGGRVSYAVCQGAASAFGSLSDPARARFRSLISPFSHTPADHARGAQSRAALALESYAEQPLAVELDARALARFGTAAPAAPKTAPGTLYGRARAAFGDVALYRARARGVDCLGSVPTERLPYLHTIAATRRFIVLTLTPLVYDLAGTDALATVFAHTRWQPELGTQFILVEKETGRTVGRWETDAFFTLHHFHAFERGDELLVDLVAYPDARIVQENGRRVMPAGMLRRYRLLPGARRAFSEPLSSVGIELPRAAQRSAEDEQRFAYGVSLRESGAERDYDQLVKVDLHSGRDRIWTAAGCAPGEPILVRRPGARAADDGVVLSVVWDATHRAAFLLVLDAASFVEIGRAHLPQRLPPPQESHHAYALVY